jgi:hypothetical protein
MYSPTAASLTINEWPTMGNLIDSGKRVLGFIDNQADSSQVSYLIDHFSNMFEDAYGKSSESPSSNTSGTSADAQMSPTSLSDVVLIDRVGMLPLK